MIARLSPRLVVVAAASAAIIAGATFASAAQATPAMRASGGSCFARLSDGLITVSRTTMYVGDGWRTAIVFDITGDAANLVTDRVIGLGTKGTINRIARGIGGQIDGTRSWSFHHRRESVVGHFAGVDAVTGKIWKLTC